MRLARWPALGGGAAASARQPLFAPCRGAPPTQLPGIFACRAGPVRSSPRARGRNAPSPCRGARTPRGGAPAWVCLQRRRRRRLRRRRRRPRHCRSRLRHRATRSCRGCDAAFRQARARAASPRYPAFVPRSPPPGGLAARPPRRTRPRTARASGRRSRMRRRPAYTPRACSAAAPSRRASARTNPPAPQNRSPVPSRSRRPSQHHPRDCHPHPAATTPVAPAAADRFPPSPPASARSRPPQKKKCSKIT